jgi:hypothetical protein
VTGGKPIAVQSQTISGVSALVALIAFYDIHGRYGEVVFLFSVPVTIRDYKIVNQFNYSELIRALWNMPLVCHEILSFLTLQIAKQTFLNNHNCKEKIKIILIPTVFCYSLQTCVNCWLHENFILIYKVRLLNVMTNGLFFKALHYTHSIKLKPTQVRRYITCLLQKWITIIPLTLYPRKAETSQIFLQGTRILPKWLCYDKYCRSDRW